MLLLSRFVPFVFSQYSLLVFPVLSSRKFFCSIQIRIISYSRSKFAICFLFKWSTTYWKWQQRWRPYNSWQENIWNETHTFICWDKVAADKTGPQNSSHLSLIFKCAIKCHRMLKNVYRISLNRILPYSPTISTSLE